jgi:hypothetical protein
MKEKLQKEVVRIGTKHVDHTSLNTVEAISMSAVAILALTLGTIYGDKLF